MLEIYTSPEKQGKTSELENAIALSRHAESLFNINTNNSTFDIEYKKVKFES